MDGKPDGPIVVNPHRDSLTRKVFHVRISLVWDGVRRFEVCLRQPFNRATQQKFTRNSWGGLEAFNERYFGERGEPVSADNGVAIDRYRRGIILRAWAIIRH